MWGLITKHAMHVIVFEHAYNMYMCLSMRASSNINFLVELHGLCMRLFSCVHACLCMHAYTFMYVC